MCLAFEYRHSGMGIRPSYKRMAGFICFFTVPVQKMHSGLSLSRKSRKIECIAACILIVNRLIRQIRRNRNERFQHRAHCLCISVDKFFQELPLQYLVNRFCPHHIDHRSEFEVHERFIRPRQTDARCAVKQRVLNPDLTAQKLMHQFNADFRTH